MAHFTSYDGADAHNVRAEVYVQVGNGLISEIKPSGKNASISVRVEQLRRPVHGWIATDDPVFAAIQAAHEQNREISYRIESQRKNNVPRDVPMSKLRETQDIAQENTKLIFAGLDGQLTREAVTDPAEDPSPGRIPATRTQTQQPQGGQGGRGGGLSADAALAGLVAARQAGLPQSITDASAALALAAGASVEQVMNAGVEDGPGAAPALRSTTRGRVVAQEAAPYKAYNTDGRVNLSSYAVQAAVGAERHAADMMAQYARAQAEAHNAKVASGELDGDPISPEPVNFANAAALAGVLLDLADQVQNLVRGADRADRMASSHTRARGLVYEACEERHPIPFGQGEDAQRAWREAVVAEAVERLNNAVRLVEGPPAQPTGAQVGAVDDSQRTNVRPMTAPASPPPVEGEEGFTAPTQEQLARFGSLAQAAGFDATPDSPVIAYMQATFGVASARKVHGPALESLTDWFAACPDAVGTFRLKVMEKVNAKSA